MRAPSTADTTPALLIRLARGDDAAAIADIYNREVVGSTATFDTEPVTVASRRAWLDAHDPARYPVIVAEEGGQVLGFASLSRWSERCAYARAAEVSVYVHHEARGRGVGQALLGALITRGRAAGLGVLLARISAEGQASVRLHESLGFQLIGIMRRVGEKFGRLLDVLIYDLHLDLSPEPPTEL